MVYSVFASLNLLCVYSVLRDKWISPYPFEFVMINLKLLIFVLVLSRTVSCAQIFDRSKSDSKRLEVINLGVAGNNSADLVQRVGKDARAEGQDLVVIRVGTNDMLNSKKLISYQEDENNYQAIIDILKTSVTEILLMSSPPV